MTKYDIYLVNSSRPPTKHVIVGEKINAKDANKAKKEALKMIEDNSEIKRMAGMANIPTHELEGVLRVYPSNYRSGI